MYSTSEVPEYAFRELAAGPLHYWVLAYNILANRNTVEEAIEHLSRLSRFQPRAGWSGTRAIVRGLVKAASVGSVPEEDLKPALLGFLLREIQKAWASRKRIAQKVVQPLACLADDDFVLQDGALRLESGAGTLGCDRRVPCSAAAYLRAQPESVAKLVQLLKPAKGVQTKRETAKRRHALKEVMNRRAESFPQEHCRHLGDAYFCVLAPPSADILTTNLADFEPMARVLGKRVRSV
jgi:hypothetical protein